jgi:hypothetical protein
VVFPADSVSASAECIQAAVRSCRP